MDQLFVDLCQRSCHHRRVPHTDHRNYFTEDHQIFRETVRKFALSEILPQQKKWESEKFVPKEIFLKLGEQGFLGITHDPAYGGSGCDYWYKVVFCEEMTACRMNGFVMDVMVHTDMTTPVIAKLGSEDLKKEVLIPAIKGEKVCALGVTEPDAGSDVAHIRTTARPEGDCYVINGAKTFITNGSRADYIVLACRTGTPITQENFNEAHRALSFIVFPTRDDNGNLTPGFKVGRKLEKLGNDSSDTAELSFENCRIPKRYLLGEENKGFYYVMRNFQGERLVAAIMSVAGCRQLLRDAALYGIQRHAFGRPILSFQVWRHKFADLATQIEAGQELTYRACDLFSRGIDCVKEITMAKLFATELINKVAYECLQIHGGAGYIKEYDVERVYRDVRLLTIGAGTSEIMKEILSKEMSKDLMK